MLFIDFIMIGLLIVGISLIYIILNENKKKCPAPQIEYRFIPRTFKEEQENPVKVSDIFDSMFNSTNIYLDRTLGKPLKEVLN